eukprot:m.306566 g.306566  ORF g.306566 m.306566 type:complete len:1681 (+) comp41359_c0_seq1:127-5169(+)
MSPRTVFLGAVFTLCILSHQSTRAQSGNESCCSPKSETDVIIDRVKQNKKGLFLKVNVSETTCDGVNSRTEFQCLIKEDERACLPRKPPGSSLEPSGNDSLIVKDGGCNYTLRCFNCSWPPSEGSYQLDGPTPSPPVPTTVSSITEGPDGCKLKLANGTRVSFSHGDSVVNQKKKKCQHCSCDNGEVTCDNIQCESEPECDRDLVASEKSCCPICVKTIPAPTPPPPMPTLPPMPSQGPSSCKFKLQDGSRVQIQHGDFVVRSKKRKCLHCNCYDGAVRCGEVPCDPVPGCIRHADVSWNTSCCPDCLEFAASPKPTSAMTEPPMTPGPCDILTCKKYQECVVYKGKGDCKDTCNGPCKEGEVCVLEDKACDATPCYKRAVCKSKGKVGDTCYITYKDGRTGIYKDGRVWVKDLCTLCTCVRGIAECKTINCTVVGCIKYDKPIRGSCCGKCVEYNPKNVPGGGCVDDEVVPQVIRNNGDTWSGDACNECNCIDGRINCTEATCSIEEGCIEVVDPEPGECCPTCKKYAKDACKVENGDIVRYVDVGATWEEKCVNCQCKKKNSGKTVIKCKPKQKCPKIRKKDCNGNVEVPEGKCCPECVPIPTTPPPTMAPPRPCVVDMVVNITIIIQWTHYHNETWRPSTCEHCHCNDSNITCRFVQNVDCPDVPGCVKYAERVGKECCTSCVEYEKPTVPPGKPCFTSSGKFDTGSYFQPDRCHSCMCDNGTTNCIRLQCHPIPDCDEYGDIPEGECCPICNTILGRSSEIASPCEMQKEEGPCFGRFPRFFFDQEDFACKPFFYSGCAGNPNSFVSKSKCEHVCSEYVRKENSCDAKPDYGACTDVHDRQNASFRRFFYNATSMKCERFTYSSCGGNANNFQSRKECMSYCSPPSLVGKGREEVCGQRKQTGPCRAKFPRYFYHRNSGQCRPFFYGGCGGNENNFKSMADCQIFCLGADLTTVEPTTMLPLSPTLGIFETEIPPDELCILPMAVGPCKALIPRYYFNFDVKRCERFNYGGCDGNANNFETLAECQSLCPKLLYPMEACQLPVTEGPCKANLKRYYYNTVSAKCEKFVYGGCLGNSNNFLDMASCMRHCAGGLTPCLKRKEEEQAECNKQGCFISECDENGNFLSKQCNSMGYCWCVEEDGQEVDSTRVPPWRAGLLRCGKNAEGLKKCLKRQQRQLRKCGDDSFCFVYDCKADGSYATRQCTVGSGECFCVNRNGKRIPSAEGTDCGPSPTTQGPTTRKPTAKLTTAPTTVAPTTSLPSTEALTTEAVETMKVTESPTDGSTPEPTAMPLCGGMPCPYGDCVEGKCKCVKTCPSQRKAVCGTNGQTYRNMCEMEMTACLQMREIKVDYMGRCGSRVEPEPTSGPVCSQPPVTGRCRGYFPRFFYNMTSKSCEKFIYGGCAGNDNNFATVKECAEKCVGPCVCALSGSRFLQEGETGMTFGVDPSSVVEPCIRDVVFFTDMDWSYDYSDLRRLSKEITAGISGLECKNPVIRFGWTRINFNEARYETMQIGGGIFGSPAEFRVAVKKVAINKSGVGVFSAALDLYKQQFCQRNCSCSRDVIMVADRTWEPEPLGENTVQESMKAAEVVVYSFVPPSAKTNQLAAVAGKTGGRTWPYKSFLQKKTRDDFIDAITTSASRSAAGNCHHCKCSECEMKCCRVFNRDEDSCRAGMSDGSR